MIISPFSREDWIRRLQWIDWTISGVRTSYDSHSGYVDVGQHRRNCAQCIRAKPPYCKCLSARKANCLERSRRRIHQHYSSSVSKDVCGTDVDPRTKLDSGRAFHLEAEAAKTAHKQALNFVKSMLEADSDVIYRAKVSNQSKKTNLETLAGLEKRTKL